MIDKFYYLVVILAAMSIGTFVYKNKNHKKEEKTLPNYDIQYVDAFSCDSTGKYLIDWKGDTCKRKTKLEE